MLFILFLAGNILTYASQLLVLTMNLARLIATLTDLLKVIWLARAPKTGPD